MNTSVKADKQYISVIDKSGLFEQAFESTEELEFTNTTPDQEQSIIELLKSRESTHLVVIPEMTIDDLKEVRIYSSKNSSPNARRYVRDIMADKVRDLRIKKLGLEPGIIDQLNPDIQINNMRVSEEGVGRDYSDIAQGLAMVLGFLNYFFIFIYGSLILRGVHEEKSNRIVEIIISSVKPFELMMGKIIGVAMVGLTQFLLWVLFIVALNAGLGGFSGSFGDQAQQGFEVVSGALAALPMLRIILFFIFFFISGYLLYSSLFAAIAASVDNQSDMQQFMLPLTIPLIIAIVAVQVIIEAPGSSLAVWLSMIPFTSPIVMVGRIAVMDVPVIELVGSMLLMVAGIILTVWVAAKIYRIGILIFGSKVSYKEMWKWLWYK